MAKQLNVNLAFTADTGKAKAQLQDLQSQLTKISNTGNLNLDFDKSIKSVLELKAHLQEATNVNTGNLDFSKLNASLSKSNKSLEDYANDLRQLGPDGEKAFLSLANAVAASEIPIKRSNALLTEMWTTLKNTARWQISSSILHGFMGSIQSAYGYAQDLNESLNNIRIVTGQSIDDMARFAEQANKAAKALSTTTTEYTNASLIYYQQGLNDTEVQKRTDITVKMANVARQSAEVVSDQMTAVWNNFYDGSKSLEYYADVMTALGAATASSTDEIAGGLEKFAAVADTIGLSYEYAASALATITSNTRQSEEVVGTALKTIFARIQGLNLGETLDDGTTLNKYSKALEKVGISIFDQQGELKKMDDILDEMASKWETLDKSQQTALAQTVAGVRQYTQLVALMENWNNGDNDSMTANLTTTRNANGALDEQADIYAESWEAAQERVTAAAERIYATLLNDEAFITILNVFEDILTYVGNTIDAFGGLGGVLTTLGALATKVFKNQMAQGLTDLAYNIKMSTKAGRKEVADKRKATIENMVNMVEDDEQKTPESEARANAMRKELELQYMMIDNSDRMSETEKMINQSLLDRQKILSSNVQEYAKAVTEANKAVDESAYNISSMFFNAQEDIKNMPEDNKKNRKAKEKAQKRFDDNKNQYDSAKGIFKDATKSRAEIDQLQKSLKKVDTVSDETKASIKDLLKSIQGLDENTIKEIEAALDDTELSVKDVNTVLTELDMRLDGIQTDSIQTMETAVSNIGGAEMIADVDAYTSGVIVATDANAKLKQSSDQVDEVFKKVSQSIEQANGNQATWADKTVAVADAAMTAISAVQAVSGIIDVLNDPDMSGVEKFLAVMTTIGSMVPMVIMSVTGLQTAFAGQGAAAAASAAGNAAGAAGMAAAGAGAAGAIPPVTGLSVSFNSLIWPITLVVGAIALLTAGLIALSEASLKEEREAEKAAKTAEELATAYDEAKGKADALKNAFNGYDSVVEKLNSCTKGTQEWYQALEEVNNEVLTLLQEFPELARYENLFTRDKETGQLTINEQVRDQVIADTEKRVDSAQLAALAGDARLDEANLRVQEKQVGNSIGHSRGVGAVHSTGQGGSSYYDDYLDVGKILTDNALNLANLTEEEFRSKVRDLLIEESSETAQKYANFNNQIDGIVNSCVTYQDQINTLALNTEQTANKMLNIGQLISEEALGDNFNDTAKDVATNAMGSIQQQIYDDIIEQDKKNAQANTNTEVSRDIWERFNKANNSNLIAVENQIQGDDNNRQYAYVGADGKTAIYSIEYIASTIAAYEAINEKLPEIAEKATTAFNTMEESFKATFGEEEGLELGQGIKDYISNGNFESLNQSQVDSLKTQANGDTATFLRDVIFSGLTDEEIAQALGADSFDQAVSEWEAGLDGISTALASAGDDLSKTPKTLFNNLFSSSNKELEKISVDEKENLAKAYQEIFNEFGEEGLTAFNKMMQESGEYADEFASILKDVDWSTTDLETLKGTLEAAGISTDGWDEGLGYLIESMQKATEATITLAEAQQNYASMQEFANIQMGDTISKEQMDSLTELNPAYQSFFQLMADGTYMLIEDAEYFKGVMDDMSFKGHYDLIDQYETRLNNSEKLSRYDYGELNQRASNEFEAANQISYLENAGYSNKALLEEAKISLDGQHDSQEYLDELRDAVGEVGDLTQLTTEELEAMESEIESIQDTISFSDYTDRISEVGLEFAATEEYAKSLEEELDAADGTIDGVAEGYNDITQAARDMAIANQRLDRGLSSLADNLDNYTKKLKDANTNSTEYKEALSDLKTDIADIFNTSADMISDKFIEENLVGDPEVLKQIADGNMDVINAMRQSVAEDILLNVTTRMNTSELEQFPEWFATFQENFPDLETGVFLNPESEMEFVNALNNMIAAAGMTRDEVSNLLGSMGMSATLTTTYKEQEVEVPIYTTATKQTGEVQVPVTRVKGDGTTETLTETYPVTETMTTQTGVAKMMGYVPVTAIETEGADGTTSGGVIDILTNSQNSSAPKISPSSSNVYNPSTGEGGYTGKKNESGGGGGKESQPADKVKETKHSDIVDRYKEVDDAIDDVADALEDVNKLTDRMYGKSHINGLKEQNRLLQEEIGLLHNKVAEAKAYLAVDRQNLANAAAQAGVSLNIDSSGNISNYTSEMNRLYNELAAAEQAWNASYQSKTQEDQQAYQENVLDPLKEKIDGLKEAIAQYDETRELIEDLENELDDKFYEWQDNNYEILHYTLEIEIELNDLELQEIEYYLDKISDDFYSMAEGLAYMNKQIPLWSDTLGDYETFYNGLNDAFAKGEISQAAYVEGLKESYEGIFETLSALNELDDEMLHYYEDTLSAASDELATYTDHLEHLTGVLEHYKNIVELVNGEYDYDRIGAILEGQADSLNSELQVLKANYEMMLKEKQEIEQAYNNATAEEREVYEAELKAITAALDEAQDEMLSKTEEWAEAMKAIMENTIAAAGKELEDAFTGGIGFDSLANSLERLNSFNDEYLTKTNQIYETQKLMRQAQQASDRTDNQASKIKLKNFINETQQLQEKNKLSNLDLEIQQARYELLLAELALEEAQNAKATVRLQRDNEGNFGYVYTADLEAVTEREQALADAENALYNIGLNAANEYGQRRLELQQQLADELIALNERRNNGEFATDALYYAERDRIMAEYTDLFIAYSDQYTTALGVDAEIQQDAWIQAYDKMIDQTANWKDHTEEYLSNCEDAYSNWRDLVANESDQINDILNGVEDNVKDIVDESKNLSNTLVSQVIPAINQELIAVRNVTSAYASQRAQIMQLIVYYEQLCASIRAAIAAQAAMDNAVASNNSRYESGTVGGSGGGSGSGGRGNGGGSGGGSGGNDASSLAKEAQELVKNVHYGNVKNDGSGWKKDARAQGYSEDAITIANRAFNDSKPNDQQINQWDYFYDEALKLAGQYNTGGYTGAFGSAGRLAVLHEKELVLNKEDTENFLAATDILRGISKVIDLEAAQSTYAAARLVSGTIGEAKEVLEQIVKIEASFPAVSDRNEIEAAFNNLINTASQYANRKR